MIKKILRKVKKDVDSEIKEVLKKRNPKELYNLMRYHLFSGGKRVRPALCLISCSAVCNEWKKALPAAAALELLHAFTLAHDDVMDEDKLRRGKETLWYKFGDALAINAGDGMFSKAYECLLNLDVNEKIKLEVIKEFTKTIIEICEGQALDISFEKRKSVSLNEYINMAKKKTATLFATSLKIGAMIGNGKEREINTLKNYGRKVGIAFQIWDDYIDFSSNKTGKCFASDIKKGKKTFIVCHALERLESKKRKKLLYILSLSPKDTTLSLITEAINLLNDVGSIKYAKIYAQRIIKSAKNDIKILNESNAKDFLMEFADFVVSRKL